MRTGSGPRREAPRAGPAPAGRGARAFCALTGPGRAGRAGRPGARPPHRRAPRASAARRFTEIPRNLTALSIDGIPLEGLCVAFYNLPLQL
ncbi:hypothetical protein EVAR_7288_1 [Eumeta japonica]|uniref:Uncharacterized protein n=1 Tax=Eumeta variegata TaxID=151549 RepID=A0A4C1T3C8_EUMVA|nr:hypothetical protein EVAR_7288_1 [Eumeta japonica]